jgi:hypothetical protein
MRVLLGSKRKVEEEVEENTAFSEEQQSLNTMEVIQN